ncbi:alpha-mannosidase [Konateibacter massiliensis]|uniref:alpha-mannosidase n=1 Tax=Konateibacter massiliensis TaxID=2002841 RepID=UPI000C148CCF|nr:glycoside hydrolase family 38 C-terminal domain-containing protein [Konateibacter massiliensis]
MYNITRRLENLLDALKKEINPEEIAIHDIQMKKLGYDERTTFLQEKEGYESFEAGERFGEWDQHYCFKAKISLPQKFMGKRVVFCLKTGATDIWNTDNPQFILYLDGEMLCALDMNHYECILSEYADKNEYEIALYAYTNTGTKDVILDMKAAVQSKEVQKLYYDLFVPFETAVLLKEEDERRLKMLGILNETMNRIDFRRTGSEEFYASVSKAQAYLEKNFYETMCKESDINVYSIGHTHIDVAWKWRVRQTREKVIRSFSTVLYLMDRYPDYKFMSSQPQLYQFVKEDAPELFEKIKERVKEGRWETEGAMWLEPDCNLSSGESLIRHIIYGKKFFKEEFGKENVILWLPDVFGYSAALPQILKKSGIHYFMTTKIGWNEYNKIPNDTFLWQGIDGSEILTYFITTRNYEPNPELRRTPDISTTYNGLQNPSQIMGTWQRFQNKELSKDVLTCYGYGDGGGGTTPKMLEQSERLKRGIPGCPTVKHAFAREFFEKLEENLKGKQIPKWCGDLYLEFHRGTYTSMGRNKRNNRKMEFALREAEFFQTLAFVWDASFSYEKEKLEEAWKLLLLNQFHDILPGSSIGEVYEDSDQDYKKIKELTTDLSLQARKKVEEQSGGSEQEGKAALYLWNTLSFARDEIVLLPKGVKRVVNRGRELEIQNTQDGCLCHVADIPANGYTLLFYEEESEKAQVPVKNAADKSFETKYYKVNFNETGELTSLYDKLEEREVLKENRLSNELVVYEDRPYEFDAWNIDSFYTEKSYLVNEVTDWTVEKGSLCTKVICKKRFLDSSIVQEIIFYENTRRIDFKTEVDWKQEQLLLKARFALDLLTTKATCDIQYGNIVRNTHKNTSWEQAQFEVCAHKWVDMSEASYGVALMNDCKYGYSFEEADISITLIKSGIFPFPDADKEVHHFTYSIYPHTGDFREGEVIQNAYQLNVPCILSKAERQSETICDFSLFGTLPEHVILESMKKAENSDEVILRLYDAYGKRGKVTLDLKELHATRAWICNMLEEKEQELLLSEDKVIFEIKPYEIITISVEKSQH